MYLHLNKHKLTEIAPTSKLVELSDQIFNINIENQRKWHDSRIQEEIDSLKELWEEAGTDLELYDWLKSVISKDSVDSRVKYKVLVDPYVIQACEYPLRHIIEVIKSVCDDYKVIFGKIVEKPETVITDKVLDPNTEKEYQTLINDLYDCCGSVKCDDYSFWYATLNVTSTFYCRDCESKEYRNANIPLCEVDSIELFFNDGFEILDGCINRLNTQEILKEVCTVFFEMNKDERMKLTDLYDRLCKLIGMYYSIIHQLYSNHIEAVEFIVDYIYGIIKDAPFAIDEDGYVGESNYPESSAKAWNIARTCDSTDKSKSVEAIDSAYNFGASQLNSNKFSSSNFAVNKLDDKYKAKFSKLNNVFNEVFKVKPSKMKAKINSAYFKKWYGKIPSMYNVYGGEAMVTENRMKGDPTLILANTLPKYLTSLVTETNKMFQGLIDVSKRVAAANDINAKINIVKSYCTNYRIEDVRDPKEIQNAIKNEAILRIAKCIFQGNEIYGFTPEGIVENGKFPTANHIVVSMFSDNAHEEPVQLPVNQIFSRPDSITVFAHPQKIATFDELFKKVSNSIVQGFNHKIVSNVHNSMEVNYKNYANSLRKKSEEIDSGDADEATLNKKIAKAIETGIVNGLDLAIDQKARCLQVSGACFDMVVRVQRLAKLCVAALHETESQHADTRMNAGINNGVRNATNARLNAVNKTNNDTRYINSRYTRK